MPEDRELLNHEDFGLRIVEVESEKIGFQLAENLIRAHWKEDTVLFLSGGRTPQGLYRNIANWDRLSMKTKLGAAALVDERFGRSYHKDSNEKMLQDTGLLSFFESSGIPFYRILREDTDDPIRTTEEYEKTLQGQIFAKFPYRVSIVGIGKDGHTAGIMSERADFKNPLFDQFHKSAFVSSSHDAHAPDGFERRITLTPGTFSEMDFNIMLAFGEEKKAAFSLMLQKGKYRDIASVPARLFLDPDIARKTHVITDQNLA